MQITIHIGSAKTGTTSVQRALHLASDALAERGVVYHTPDRHFSHNLLSVLYLDRDKWPRVYGSANPDKLIRRARDNLSGIRKRVHEGADHVMLSGETLFNLPPHSVRRMSRALARRFGQEVRFTIVVYIADPASHYLRLSQQKLKASRHIPDPHQFRYAFLRAIRNWSVIDDVRFIVRPYRRDLLTDACIVRDFSQGVFGDPAMLGESITANSSLCAESMVVLHDMQLGRPARDENRFTPAARESVKRLFEIEREFEGRTAPRLRPEVSAMVVRNHMEDLRAIEAEFGGFSAFLDDGEGAPGPDPFDGARPRHVRDILSEYNRDLAEEIAARFATFEPPSHPLSGTHSDSH